MQQLTHSAYRNWLLRPSIAGTPLYWGSRTGALGAMLGGLLPAALYLPEMLGAPAYAFFDLLALCLHMAVISGLAGASIGLVHPMLLEKVRGRVPIPVLAVAATATGAAGGGLSGLLAILWIFGGVPALEAGLAVPFAAMMGAKVGAVAATLWWLPATVSATTGRSWPVTSAVGLGLPLLVLAFSLI